MFTEYKFSPADISVAAADAAKALSKARPGVNPATFAAETIAARLTAKPETYFQYGPYWWAVKAALRTLGQDFGPSTDEPIRAQYGAAFPAYAALVAGERFRDFYNGTFLQGTAQFDLDADGDQNYTLFDPDMEIRRLGAEDPLMLAEALRSRPVDGEGVLDGVEIGADPALTPFAVRFEHEAALWTANVYAPDAEAARVKLSIMERSGRIGRAIEFVKLAGEPTMDSTDMAAPLFVDRDARIVSEMASTGALAR
jgi:hypothetical protein